MELVLISLAASGVLVLLVLALHWYQLNAAQAQLERRMPLPPIDTAKLDRQGSISPGPGTASTLSRPQPPRPETQASLPEGTKISNNSMNWLDQVGEYKRVGDTHQALALCRQHFPLWSAFQQSTLILRNQIRSAQAEGKPIQNELEQLYRIAAVAALLHDRSEDETVRGNSRLRQVPVEEFLELPMPYLKIGYLQLGLVKKSDIRLLLDAWGRPEMHQSPREFHREFWDRLGTPAPAGVRKPAPGALHRQL